MALPEVGDARNKRTRNPKKEKYVFTLLSKIFTFQDITLLFYLNLIFY